MPSSHSAWPFPQLQHCGQAEWPQPARSPPATALPNFYLLLQSLFSHRHLVLSGHCVVHRIPTGMSLQLLFPVSAAGRWGGYLCPWSPPRHLRHLGGKRASVSAVGFLSMNCRNVFLVERLPVLPLISSSLSSRFIWDLSQNTCNLYVLPSLISATLMPKLIPDLLSSSHRQAARSSTLWYWPNASISFILNSYPQRAEQVDEKVANQLSSSCSPVPWQ